MDEGRKRVIGIIAGILAARHFKTAEDLFNTGNSPYTDGIVAALLLPFSGQSGS